MGVSEYATNFGLVFGMGTVKAGRVSKAIWISGESCCRLHSGAGCAGEGADWGR